MLSELTASSRRLALVGLAKNTGKTETLAALLRELQAEGRRVGVTSVGRDGEERDAIDARIAKPRIVLPGESLVATTNMLLRASGLPHELLEETEIRTPLGRVVIARLHGPGAVEVAGPSAAADVRAVSDAMLAHGAVQVLIDGAIDRRAASSPDVADGLVVSTGAVLDRQLAEVVRQTSDAVELTRLPPLAGAAEVASRVRTLAAKTTQSVLIDEDVEPIALPPRFVLTAEGEQIERLLDTHRRARWLIVAGALPERFLGNLIHAARPRRRTLVLVVADPTKVFLSHRGLGWYRAQGIVVQTLRTLELRAITVNPLAPESHCFDSTELTTLLREMIPDVPIFDVFEPGYLAASA